VGISSPFALRRRVDFDHRARIGTRLVTLRRRSRHARAGAIMDNPRITVNSRRRAPPITRVRSSLARLPRVPWAAPTALPAGAAFMLNLAL